jgi:hypothetical protein
MIALKRNEFFGKGGEGTPFSLHNPVEFLRHRQIIVILARDAARLASDALGRVNRYSIAWHFNLLGNGAL